MPFFVKPPEQPEAMQLSNAKNGTGRKKAPKAMSVFEKPQMQPEAIDFQLRKSDMKEKGAGGYDNFRKTPNALQSFSPTNIK